MAIASFAAVALVVFWLRPRASDPTQRYGLAALAVFAAQLALGAVNVFLKAPVWLQLVHLAVADVLWILLVLMAAESLTFLARVSEAGTPRGPESKLYQSALSLATGGKVCLAGVTSAMALLSGSRLGPYEILSLLGAGGMGQVYRARDTRLDRMVAVKVLSPGLADSPEALARFEREAKAVAALSHTLQSHFLPRSAPIVKRQAPLFVRMTGGHVPERGLVVNGELVSTRGSIPTRCRAES